MRIPLYAVLTLVLSLGVLTFVAHSWVHVSARTERLSDDCDTRMHQVRITDFQYTRPLLLVDVDRQNEQLATLKTILQKSIEARKQAGILQEASLYVRDLNSGAWIAIGEKEEYSPGSLLKLARLVATLKDAESDPGLLNKKLLYQTQLVTEFQPTFLSDTLVPGRSYTVRDLLHRMIAHSDNNATFLLNQVGSLDTYLKLFKDLGLREPNLDKDDYPTDVEAVSRFFRVLYNATYLNKNMSEHALSLLTQCAFQEGIVKYLDSQIPVAHKFGERASGPVKQLHEVGIVYLRSRPYLLCIMTKGWNYMELPGVLSELSEIVFTEMMHGASPS